jgi:pteridine reductase
MSRCAFITGSAHRIGKMIALHLAGKKYDLALHYNRSKSEMAGTLEEIKAKNIEAAAFRADFTKFSQVSELFDKVIKKFPLCDLLISNAAVYDPVSFSDTSREVLNRSIDVNFKAPFFLTQAFSKTVKNGHIIHILDSRITKNKSKNFLYTSTKKMLADFTRMAAVELGPNIRVNAIAPGLLLPADSRDEKLFDKLEKNIPLRKKCSVESLLKTLDFLIDTTDITGQILFVDGGQNL